MHSFFYDMKQNQVENIKLDSENRNAGHCCIIGAGPIGLYTAIKLVRSGVAPKNITIYDPRAGQYTRQGHLDSSSFVNAITNLRLGDITPKNPFYSHIKNFEQMLYSEAQKLNISLQLKSFVGFQKDSAKQGIIFKNAEGVEEIQPATKFVFDCTGSNRKVVHAVNHLYPQEPPFKLEAFTKVPVTKHFFAYVKMKKSDREQFYYSNIRDKYLCYDFRSIIELYKLGWCEMKLPRCYGVPFGEEKVCLYLEAPPDLPLELHKKWFETVIKIYYPSVHYEHVKKLTKKGLKRNTFGDFSVNANVLNKVSHTEENFPTVIILGDAQIDPYYYLSHGTLDGMKQVDALFDSAIKIKDGAIHHFDQTIYEAKIKDLHSQEINRLKNEYSDTIEEMNSMKIENGKNLADFLPSISNASDKKIVTEILKETGEWCILRSQDNRKNESLKKLIKNISDLLIAPINKELYLKEINQLYILTTQQEIDMPEVKIQKQQEIDMPEVKIQISSLNKKISTNDTVKLEPKSDGVDGYVYDADDKIDYKSYRISIPLDIPDPIMKKIKEYVSNIKVNNLKTDKESIPVICTLNQSEDNLIIECGYLYYQLSHEINIKRHQEYLLDMLTKLTLLDYDLSASDEKFKQEKPSLNQGLFKAADSDVEITTKNIGNSSSFCQLF